MLEHYLSHKQHFEFEIILHDNHNTDCFKIQILFFMNFKSGQQAHRFIIFFHSWKRGDNFWSWHVNKSANSILTSLKLEFIYKKSQHFGFHITRYWTLFSITTYSFKRKLVNKYPTVTVNCRTAIKALFLCV